MSNYKLIRSFIVILTVQAFMVGCNHHEAKVKPKVDPWLYVMVYDTSKSSNHLLLTEDELSRIFEFISFNGGGVFYGIFIAENSEIQDGWSWEIERIDTLDHSQSDFLEVEKIKRHNLKVKEQYERNLKGFLTEGQNVFLVEKDQNFSDVRGALHFAKVISESTAYSTFKKVITVFSDCQHDLGNEDIFSPVAFGTTINAIRPSSKINLEDVFGSSQVEVFARPNEVILKLLNEINHGS